MVEEIKSIMLPEGRFQVRVQVFAEEERQQLQDIYLEWRNLSNKLRAIESRAGNIPDGLSEGVFCLATGAVRLIGGISGANSSFDCYDPHKETRIQIKAASVIPDLTSFGPKSVWDELYFLDFYREGNWDGSVDIYYIPNEYIYGNPVNRKQSFSEQQAQGRRPRFSIYRDIIEKYKLQPQMTYNLL
jgi:hypothetical protein